MRKLLAAGLAAIAAMTHIGIDEAKPVKRRKKKTPKPKPTGRQLAEIREARERRQREEYYADTPKDQPLTRQQIRRHMKQAEKRAKNMAIARERRELVLGEPRKTYR